MKYIKQLLIIISLFTVYLVNAQEAPYRASREKINDLVHTKLKVSFDFENSQMPAKAWITLTPHFYPVQEVTLDAKEMIIEKVSRDGKKLSYQYDGNKLKIKLGNTYAKGESYTIYIKYIARPERIKSEGSNAITDEKGLYFIDPKGTDPEKPTEIWTQGETHASSVWFPTIDATNQKSSQEIYMTVPNKYVTLSNGLKISETVNNDGTRTDYWKMDEKHAPYLFFMGVGDFAIIKDSYKGKEVNYYVDHEYAPYAQEIFGNTPEMMAFFSKLTGVEFPWVKYDQMVAVDYVSGAMENTTATLHSDAVYQTSGQLVDQNTWEDTIAHELFHQWFGDYVTTESFSNLTVNESFANYSEYLWREYKYGKDHADAHRHKDVQQYLNSGSYDKKLVRFHYYKEMEMFDLVSYQKGGAILHMLRNFLGDKAFFAGLHKYLEDHKFGTGEAHQLRLAMEDVSGRDLNWFFNQWYFDSGHPILDIKYDYDSENQKALITINQSKKVFKFPVKINVYIKGKKETFNIWVDEKDKTYSLNAKTVPDLIDFDVDKTLIAKITDNKTIKNYVYQYNNTTSYENRSAAIVELAKHLDDQEAVNTIIKALDDAYYGLRIKALKSVDLLDNKFKTAIKKVEKLAKNDKKTLVKALALEKLAVINKDISIYEKAMTSPSIAVRKSALKIINRLDEVKAYAIAKTITDKQEKNSMKDALIAIFLKNEDKTQYNFIAKNILKGMFFSRDPKVQGTYQWAFQTIAASDDLQATTILVDDFVSAGLKYKQYGVDKMVKQMLQQVVVSKSSLTSSNKQKLLDVVNNGLKKLN